MIAARSCILAMIISFGLYLCSAESPGTFLPDAFLPDSIELVDAVRVFSSLGAGDGVLEAQIDEILSHRDEYSRDVTSLAVLSAVLSTKEVAWVRNSLRDSCFIEALSAIDSDAISLYFAGGLSFVPSRLSLIFEYLRKDVLLRAALSRALPIKVEEAVANYLYVSGYLGDNQELVDLLSSYSRIPGEAFLIYIGTVWKDGSDPIDMEMLAVSLEIEDASYPEVYLLSVAGDRIISEYRAFVSAGGDALPGMDRMLAIYEENNTQ